jgi:mono/diheme cytochrome c family protein
MGLQKWLPSALAVGGFIASLVILIPGYSRAQDAKAIYVKQCENCHGATGKGDGSVGKIMQPRPTDFAVSLKGKSDEWIAKAIKDGGQAVGESAVMPSYNDLSDQQIKALVDYIKKFSS